MVASAQHERRLVASCAVHVACGLLETWQTGAAQRLADPNAKPTRPLHTAVVLPGFWEAACRTWAAQCARSFEESRTGRHVCPPPGCVFDDLYRLAGGDDAEIPRISARIQALLEDVPPETFRVRSPAMLQAMLCAAWKDELDAVGSTAIG